MGFREYSYSVVKPKNFGAKYVSKFSSLKLPITLLIGAVTIFAATITTWYFCIRSESSSVIQTLSGPIQGRVAYSRDGQKFWEFLGIPYALPPLGQRKFESPEPVQPWEEVKQVTSYAPTCVQYDAMVTASLKGQMDCLVLNVFVNIDKNHGNFTLEKKPVLVWLHGGGFLSGGSWIYRPDYILDHDVVLVTLNYRLGPYGFLNVKDHGDNHDQTETNVPGGNVGLLDQTLALQWVQNNIKFFGGDADRVTLFGESAGSVSAQLHILSPKSKGLFHRAVLQSGSVLAPWSFSYRPKDVAVDYAKVIGCPTENMTELFKCFNDTEWQQLLKFQLTFLDPFQRNDLFAPSVDGTFLNKVPLSILTAGDFPAIPIMWGVNSGEGGLRTGRLEAMPELIPELDEKWTDLISNFLTLDEPLPSSTAKMIRQQYFGNLTKFTDDVETFKRNLTYLVSDCGFFYPAHKSAILHAKAGAPTYLYYFNYTSNFYPGAYNLYSSFSINDWLPSQVKVAWAICVDWVVERIFGGKVSHAYGISHAEDLYQLWNIFGASRWFSFFDRHFSRAYVKTIVDFANATAPLKFRDVAWPSINEHLNSQDDEYTIPYMLMDNEEEPKVVPEPFANRIKFWSELKDWKY